MKSFQRAFHIATARSFTFHVSRLESNKDVADIKLSQHLDYESNTQYTLIVRVQNKYQLAAETTVVIEVLDVNDNIPVFREMKKGSVLENEPPGVPVMQVRAIDADGTSAHNQVPYKSSPPYSSLKEYIPEHILYLSYFFRLRTSWTTSEIFSPSTNTPATLPR